MPRNLQQQDRLQAVSRAGLINPSNTCYMNSTLQCLATLESLHNLLADADPTSAHAKAPFSSPSLQALLSESGPAALPVTGALSTTLRKLWNQKGGTINAKELLKTIGTKSELFGNIDEQHDVEEVFGFLTGCLWDEEMDLIKKIRPPVPPTPKKKRRRKTISTREQAIMSSESSASEGNSSSSSSSDNEVSSLTPEASPDPSSEPILRPFIDTLFGGKLASIIVCEECKHVSIVKEPFQDLSVELDKDEKPRRRDRIRQFLSKNTEPTPTADSSRAPLTRQPSNFASLSETEGSASEADIELGELNGKSMSDLSRRRSLDPSALRARKGIFTRSRDSSPARRVMRKHSSTMEPPLPRPSPEQAAYIKRLLADIPGAAVVPLPTIRMAQPNGKPKVISPGSDYGPKKKEKDHHHFPLPLHNHHHQQPKPEDDAKVLGDQMSTGLYEALRRFTNVEILEGENAFQCRNCWKLLNPQLAKLKTRRQSTLQGNGAEPLATPKLSLATDGDDEAEEGNLRPLLHSSTTVTRQTQSSISLRAVSRAPSTSSSDSEIYPAHIPATKIVPAALVGGGEIARLGPIDPLTSDSSATSGSEGGFDDFTEEDANPSTAHTAPSMGSQVYRQSSLAESFMSAASAPTVLLPNLSSNSLALPAVDRTRSSIRPPKAQRYILRRAHKRLLIDALPRALVIHLKRFQQSSRTALFGSGFRDLKKIDTYVSFPLELDLSPFLAPEGKPPNSTKAGRPTLLTTPSGHHHAWFHWHHHHDNQLQSDASTEHIRLGTRYHLVGLISHSGSMSSGHYIAYVLVAPARHPHAPWEERQWIYCSDETVRPVSVSEVLGAKAYVCFYERKDA